MTIVNEYIDFLKNERGLSQNTFQSYSRDIEQFIDFLKDKYDGDILNVSKSQLLAYVFYMKNQKKAASTISRNIASLKSFFQYLESIKIIKNDPSIGIESPKVDRKLPQILSTNEVELLLEQPKCEDIKGYRDKAMLELLYATGIRVTELISLSVEDVDLKNGYIHCGAESHRRYIPIKSVCADALRNYILNARNLLLADQEDNSLFLNINGRRLTRQGFWKIIKQYKNKANIVKDITPHTLRHSFAAHLIENGEDLNVLKEILGHADISSTQIYLQIVKNQAKDIYKKHTGKNK